MRSKCGGITKTKLIQGTPLLLNHKSVMGLRVKMNSEFPGQQDTLAIYGTIKGILGQLATMSDVGVGHYVSCSPAPQ